MSQIGKLSQNIGISFSTYLLIIDSDSRHRLNFVISSTFNDNPALYSRRYVKEHPLSLDTRGVVFRYRGGSEVPRPQDTGGLTTITYSPFTDLSVHLIECSSPVLIGALPRYKISGESEVFPYTCYRTVRIYHQRLNSWPTRYE